MRWLVALTLIVASAGPRTRAVTIRDMVYRPGDLVVAVGDTVVWRNEDIVPHTVTFPGRAGPDEVAAGGTWTLVVPAGDTLAYVCRYHPSMRGRLVVR